MPPRTQAGKITLACMVAAGLALGITQEPALTTDHGVPAAAAAVAPGMPGRATLTVSSKAIGTVSRGLFGANLLWPYGAGGAFDAKTGRFFPSFVSLLRTLGVTFLRYPGGTTADSFFWQRAIGPQSRRQPNEPYGMQGARLSKACCIVDGPVPSVVGPDELGALLGASGAQGQVVVNFATGTAAQAADFVAYMTAPAPPKPVRNAASLAYWAQMRARNGHRAPYAVPYWEVGNEQMFSGQYGWRSGLLVSMGRHSVPCPSGAVATCLYAFGGTTSFVAQPVGRLANDRAVAALSNGAAHQVFYVYYPPVVPRSQTVTVGGQVWRPVAKLSEAGPKAHVYVFSATGGRIAFGDGRHGAVPAAGLVVRASYRSGPHGGFVEFYKAMKEASPQARICASEEMDATFLELMGRTYRYDCVELHEYAAPKDITAPLARYEAALMAYPAKQGAQLGRLQTMVRRYSGRNVPVVMTEYGQTVWPMPNTAPQFILSLDEALLIAGQLRQWAYHGVLLAEKYLATSSPFLLNDPRRLSIDSVLGALRDREGAPEWDPGLSIDSAMIAGPGPRFVVEPTGLVLGLVAKMAGDRLLASSVTGGPTLAGGPPGPALVTMAGLRPGPLPQRQLLVINTSPIAGALGRVVLQGGHAGRVLSASVLDGPSAAAFNTAAHPRRVTVKTTRYRSAAVPAEWSFPAHSVTLLTFSGR